MKIGNPDEFDYMIEVPALSKDVIEIRHNPMYMNMYMNMYGVPNWKM